MSRTVHTPDGRTLLVREGGVAGGVPVIVHHGTPGAGLPYASHVLDAEDKGIHLLAYDRPGYGGSGRNEGRTVADCAADVAAVADAYGYDHFCTWGVSGGGPHALAVAALLPDRCAAAAALAPVAPFDADGLDFFAGMGEQNVEEFGLAVHDPQAEWTNLRREAAALRDTTPTRLAEQWSTLLPAVDVEVLHGAFAAYLLDTFRAGVGDRVDGWFDDDLAFVTPWGFDLAAIRVPVLHWQGGEDRMVPSGHGVWLAERIPGVESRLDGSQGHLTLLAHCVPAVHEWLLERYGG